MKYAFAPILLLLFIAPAIAQLKTQVTKSKITFEIKNLGINTGGEIGGVQANIAFNPAQLNTSSIEATADVNTLNTGNDMKDTHLKSEDYFDAAKYPKITMKSVSFKHKSGDNYTGRFNVTMKDRTKPIDVAFTYKDTGGNATFTGSLKLNRVDFGVGTEGMMLANDVIVYIEVEVAK